MGVMDIETILSNNPEVIEERKGGLLYSRKIPYMIINGSQKCLGRIYYPSGRVKYEGVLQRGGLYEGRFYYPSGNLKFEGKYNDREVKGSYYGPPFPVEGKFYSGEGKLLYCGRFRVFHQGGVGWPKVVFPEGFGKF